MKKVGTVTFHASYNYGSCLQAYALQKYITNISNNEIKYEIINLRNKVQKEMFATPYEKKGLKNFLKKIIYLNVKKDLKRKNALFENFICEKLNITKEFESLEELKKANLKYDYLISGSDQIWNLNAKDFDWSYYLEFSDKSKKISYAASFGPKKQNFTNEEKIRLKKDLNNYSAISVREEGSAENVRNLINKNPLIHIDPTMLLTKEEWIALAKESKNFLPKDKYILLYDIHSEEETFEIAKRISKLTNMSVIFPKDNTKVHVFHHFVKKYDNGPIEFLDLINNAELVLSSSFHGTVFSILLQKPFYAINGMKDLRISTLLKTMELESRSIDSNFLESQIINYKDINFDKSLRILENERKKSKEYLMKELDIKGEKNDLS